MIEGSINLKTCLLYNMKQLSIFLSFFLLVASCQNKPKETSVVTDVKTDRVTKTTPEKNNFFNDSLNITKGFVLGKFNYKTDSTFTKVDAKHSTKEIYLNTRAYKAFLEMTEAAKKDSVYFKIISGTRNFYEQKAIWNRKWKKYSNLNPVDRAKKILEYSSMPSTSRHHWGTDIDLNSLNNSYFNTGKGLKTYLWLKKHANSFGFYQVYTNKNNGRTGYNEEKWHWSFVPLASKYLEFYNSNIKTDDISEFEGSQLAKDLHIIEDFVNGIPNNVKAYK